MFKRIVEMLFPEDYSCLGCGMDVFDNPYDMCDDCKKRLPFLKGHLCVRCGEPFASDGMVCKKCKKKPIVYDRAISPFIYDKVIKNLIVGLKHNKKKFHAKSLAKFMADLFIDSKLYADIIIPVPLCEKRLKERGFNQSKLIADELSAVIKIKVVDNVLFRIKETPRQATLDFQERQLNIKDAFAVKNCRAIKDKFVLLVDDVYTTGATVRECAKVLKRAGAKCVYVLTAAHTLINEEDE